MIEVGVDGQQLDANPQMKQMKNVMRALALVMAVSYTHLTLPTILLV